MSHVRTPVRRLTASFTATAIALSTVSCATQPFGADQGKPMFQDFTQCMVANGVGAVALGALARKLTGEDSVAIATVAVTLFAAWKACGQAHQKVAVSDQRSREALASDPRYQGLNAGLLSIDELEVAAPKAGQDITTSYRFTYASPDAARKDIPAKERFVFLAGFTNASGAQEFKEVEFDRDFVIQQGQRRHVHAVPSDASFGQFKPWKLRYRLEVDGRCMETEAAFDIGTGAPGRAGPARVCGASAVAAAPTAGAKSAAPAPAAAPTPPAVAVTAGTLGQALRLVAAPGGAAVGKTLPKGTPVRVLEKADRGTGKSRVAWVRVQTASGDAGWMLASQLAK